MQHRTLPRATLIALLLAGSLPAQNNEAKAADRVLAQARLAENQGNLAEAERLLRVAHDKAAPPVRDALAKGLREFLIRQGREAEAAALAPAAAAVVPPGTDPIAALIAQLETGTEGSAKAAREELGQVVELALPQLIDAVAKAGPFARLNLLQLLLPSKDPRVAERLGELVRAGDHSLALAITKRLDADGQIRGWRPSPTEAALAGVLAECALPSEALLTALRVLRAHAPADDKTRRLAERLVADAKPEIVLRGIESIAVARDTDWVKSLLERLVRSDDPNIAASATAPWIRTLRDDEEARAVAAIDRLQPKHRYWTARASLRESWAQLGITAIHNAEHTADLNGWDWLRSVRWVRGGDAAARALCGVASLSDFAREALEKMIQAGWRGSAALDAELAKVDAATLRQNGVTLLQQVLGPGDEARARAIMAAAPRLGLQLVGIAANRGWPWHELIAENLHELQAHHLNRSWRDAPASALDKLHAAVARDPEGYADDLLKSAHRWGGIPMRTLALLFATRQSLAALQLAIAQDPRATLDALASAPRLDDHLSTYLDLLRQHGTAADLRFALRVAREFQFAMGCDGGADALGRFLARFGSGNLEVLALGAMPSTGAVETEIEGRTIAAAAAAEGLQVGQVEAALDLMPQLLNGVAHAVCERLQVIVQPAHAGVVARYLDRVIEPWRALPGEALRKFQVYRAISLLRAVGTPVASEALNKLLRASTSLPSGVDYDLRRDAAKAELHVAGEARRELLQSWLGGDDALLVEIALGAAETASDPALRNLGVTTLRRLASSLQNDGGFLAAVDAETRFAASKSIVQDDAIATTTTGLACAALTALGDRKDPSLIPVLARAANHPHVDVRACCAAQLGRTFSLDAGATLLELLKDDDERVRTYADAALRRIRDYQKQRAEWEAGIRGEVLRKEGREAPESASGKR